MTRKNLFSTLRAWLAFALVPAAAARAADGSPLTGGVQGRVENSASGDFIAHVRVTVEGSALETLTNTFGEYRLENVPVGARMVRVAISGFGSQRLVLIRAMRVVSGLQFVARSLGLVGSTAAAAAEMTDAALIKRVADNIKRQTTRRLIDHRTGATFTDSSTLAPKPEISIESKFNAWFYQTWLLLDGMRRVASALDEPAYRNYGEQNLEFIYGHMAYFERQHAARMKAAPVGDGTLSPIEFYFRLSDLWHTGLAPLVMERSAATSDKKYEPYLARLREFLAKCPRLPNGTLYRPRGRLMADDPYMVVPYLVRQHRATGDKRHLDDAVQQVLGSKRVLFDSERGLYRHAWDAKRQQPLGQFWGRANGWMVLAQVELLAGLPAAHPRHAEVRAAFTAHAVGLRNAQDPAGGWHQLLDHPESWIETSCTGMFVYGLARGVNEGWLDAPFAETARRGWAALRKKITTEADIVDVCGSTDVGDVDYYLKRPRLQGDLHGFGPFLLAGSEILRLPQAQTHP